VVAHIRTEQLPLRAVTLMLLIVGLAAVGFMTTTSEEEAPELGLRKRGKTSGMLAAVACALLALRGHLDELVVTRLIDLDLGTDRRLGDLHHPRSANAVNITDGMDGPPPAPPRSCSSFHGHRPGSSGTGRTGRWEWRPPEASRSRRLTSPSSRGRRRAPASCGGTPRSCFMEIPLPAIGGMGGLALLTHTDLLLPILGGLFVVRR
jgi:hypothetical protein